MQQNLHYATYREKRLKLTASGVTFGYIDRHYREWYRYIDYKTIIITKTKKKGTIESLHFLWNDCWSTV